METIFFILAKAVAIYLTLASYAMLARVIVQFFVVPEESRLFAILLFLTEPVVVPFRLLFAKLNIAQGVPIDVPFMAAYLALTLAQLVLPVI